LTFLNKIQETLEDVFRYVEPFIKGKKCVLREGKYTLF
jgi:hypothetical protein